MNTLDLIQQQRELWNTFSTGWKKWDQFVMKWLDPIGAKLIEVADLKDDDIVLDAATGSGEPGLTAAGHLKKGKVVGIDLAEGMIEIAQERAKLRGIKNYKAKVSDASALPFKDNSFSVILCRFGVMYFAKPQEDIKELVRVLKTGGRIAFSAWAEPSKNPWATTSGRVVQAMLQIPPPAQDTPGIFRHAQPGSLTKLFQGADLHNIHESEVSGELVFDSAERYWEYTTDVVAPVAVPLSKVDLPLREKVKKEVLAKAKELEQAGKIIFPWSSWVAYGMK